MCTGVRFMGRTHKYKRTQKGRRALCLAVDSLTKGDYVKPGEWGALWDAWHAVGTGPAPDELT